MPGTFKAELSAALWDHMPEELASLTYEYLSGSVAAQVSSHGAYSCRVSKGGGVAVCINSGGRVRLLSGLDLITRQTIFVAGLTIQRVEFIGCYLLCLSGARLDFSTRNVVPQVHIFRAVGGSSGYEPFQILQPQSSRNSEVGIFVADVGKDTLVLATDIYTYFYHRGPDDFFVLCQALRAPTRVTTSAVCTLIPGSSFVQLSLKGQLRRFELNHNSGAWVRSVDAFGLPPQKTIKCVARLGHDSFAAATTAELYIVSGGVCVKTLGCIGHISSICHLGPDKLLIALDEGGALSARVCGHGIKLCRGSYTARTPQLVHDETLEHGPIQISLWRSPVWVGTAKGLVVTMSAGCIKVFYSHN